MSRRSKRFKQSCYLGRSSFRSDIFNSNPVPLLQHRLIEESKMKIFAFDGLDEAAAKAVDAAKTGSV